MTRKKLPELNESQLRQGDVLLVRTGECTQIAPAEAPVVLAYGEVTGHKHQFMAESRVSHLGRELQVGKLARLLHEEHSPATVLPGLYDLPVQTEWTDDQEPRMVAD